MRARLIVFPIKGRNWCFSRSIDKSNSQLQSSSHAPTTFKQLWSAISSSPDKLSGSNAQILVDFAANKAENGTKSPNFGSEKRRYSSVEMNTSWTALEKAPVGSVKSKIHGLGVRLLSRIKPSEIFLKSISNEITNVEVLYPPSLNARLVRRRLRHIALRGTVIHKNYFYGSATLLPLTTALTILPLPNIPFFWMLFRTYSHWAALKGSEKLLQLVSDCIGKQRSSNGEVHQSKALEDKSKKEIQNPLGPSWVLHPSKELERLLQKGAVADGLSEDVISEICKTFDLNKVDVLKYQHML